MTLKTYLTRSPKKAPDLPTELAVSPQLSLPLKSVTSTFALLAVRGAGKSNAARVMAEEMFRNGLRFVVIDPVGSWPGLRAGEHGIAIPILGGEHGDFPLTKTMGVAVADAIVDQKLTGIIDLSSFEDEEEKHQFLQDFAKRLYLRNRDPLHLFLEEADDYIPQAPDKMQKVTLRRFENIVRRGRSRGLGITLITQRSAVINKNVLTQVETLFVLRTTGPHDLEAIRGWTKMHQVGTSMLATLAGLKDGEAWVWSPHFLTRPATRFRFRRCDTYDSGATPTGIPLPWPPLVPVDLRGLSEVLTEALAGAQTDDPKVLHTRIRALEKQLGSGAQAPAKGKAVQDALSPDVRQDLVTILGELGLLAGRMEETAEQARRMLDSWGTVSKKGMKPKGKKS